MPPLEAMASGCPVAASNAGAIPEVCGDAAVLFDPTDVEAIAAAILEADERREELRERGLAQAAAVHVGRDGAKARVRLRRRRPLVECPSARRYQSAHTRPRHLGRKRDLCPRTCARAWTGRAELLPSPFFRRSPTTSRERQPMSSPSTGRRARRPVGSLLWGTRSAFGGKIRKHFDGLDVLHFPLSVMIPRVAGLPTATTVLDLQHEALPQFFSRAELSLSPSHVPAVGSPQRPRHHDLDNMPRGRWSSIWKSPKSEFARSISASTTSPLRPRR